MKRMKKMLMFVVGLVVFLCAMPAFAGSIHIPYALHAGDWWSGLSVANMGPNPIDIQFYCHWGEDRHEDIGKLTLEGYATTTRMLPDFFKKIPFPNASSGPDANPTGRVALTLYGTGPTVDRDLKAVLFVGSTGPQGGFGSHVFEVEGSSCLTHDSSTFPADYLGAIMIPYAVHYEDWWSGLAVSNTSGHDASVEIYYLRKGNPLMAPYDHNQLTLAGKFSLEAGVTVTKLLPDFFTETRFPDDSSLLKNEDGRVALIIVIKDNHTTTPVFPAEIKATLFTGNSGSGGGFSYQVFEGRFIDIYKK